MSTDLPTPPPKARPEPVEVAWLYRRSSIRLLWIVFALVLLATVVAQFFVHLHPHFEAEGWFAFNAVYGFLACVAMVLFAGLLSLLLKRPDHYYESRAAQEEHRDA